MHELGFPILTLLIVFPLAAAVLLLFVHRGAARVYTLAVSFAEVLLALPLLQFDTTEAGYQFVEKAAWVPKWGLQYYLGIDGISLIMVLLTVAILPLCVLCSWTYIQKRVKEFHVSLLLMTGACVGVFCALDLVLFYIFWEAMLVPMFLLIAVWGGAERRYASIKFFLYTLAGSVLLLAAIVALFHAGGTFSIPELTAQRFGFEFQMWIFLAFALAFAIKVPMFPFHTWLPAAHVQAPSAGSVILASILLKMGTYGFLRFCLPMTPEASVYLSPVLLALAVASIIYGGLVALGQSDIKKLIAYSSVAHMGFAMVGIFVFTREGIEGALLVMLNHGITTGGLFMMIGAIYERSHSRDISDHLGLGKYLPAFMGFWGLFSLSSLGFPGLNSFPGEALCLIGGFQGSVGLGLVMVPGAMLGAAYMLRLLQKMTYGEPPSAKGKNWLDLNYREWSYLIPLAVFVIWFGLAPGVVFKTIDPTIQRVLGEMNGKLEEPLSPALTIGGEDAANPAVRTLLLDTTPTQAE